MVLKNHKKLLISLICLTGCAYRGQNGLLFFYAEGHKVAIEHRGEVDELIITPVRGICGYKVARIPELTVREEGYSSYPVTLMGRTGLVVAREGSVLLLNCKMERGMSGAPILLGRRVIGIACRFGPSGCMGIYLGDCNDLQSR